MSDPPPLLLLHANRNADLGRHQTYTTFAVYQSSFVLQLLFRFKSVCTASDQNFLHQEGAARLAGTMKTGGGADPMHFPFCGSEDVTEPRNLVPRRRTFRLRSNMTKRPGDEFEYHGGKGSSMVKVPGDMLFRTSILANGILFEPTTVDDLA